MIIVIKLEVLQSLIRCVISSSNLKNERPISAIVTAKFESGKTSLVRQMAMLTDRCFYSTDLTAFGIIRDTNNLRDVEEGKISHIVLPDLLMATSRKRATVNTLVSFLSALIEEGVVDMSTFANKIKLSDRRSAKVNVGLLSTIPSDSFMDKRHKWERMGFLSRMLPISYQYSLTTQKKIFDSIHSQEHRIDELEKLKMSKRKVEITLSKEMSKELTMPTLELAKEQNCYGFRYLKQFQTLVKTIAYMDDERDVKPKHIETFYEMNEFINLKFKEV